MATKQTGTTDVVESVDFGALIAPIDAQEIGRAMFKRVMEAESLDAAFDALAGKTSDDFVGRTFTFTDVAFSWYESDRGPIPAAKSLVNDTATGEQVEFWTSAQMLVAFLGKAKISSAFPVTWKVVEKKTSSGQTALNFERV